MALVSITEFTTTMGHIQGANRHEEIQFPQRLDDYITDDNPVRFIDAFVDELDLEARGFRHAVAAATGRPASAVVNHGRWSEKNVRVSSRLAPLKGSEKLNQKSASATSSVDCGPNSPRW